jgi:hypothetical protein
MLWAFGPFEGGQMQLAVRIMSGSWWLMAVCLLVVFHYTMRIGTQVVERRTGRESRPEKSSIGYDLVFFGLTFAIALPPIYLLPDADPLVSSAFLMLGIVVGSLASQAAFGRKHA